MINATIMSFDALLGCGQVITDAGQVLTLPYSAIVGRDNAVLPSERDWRWLDRIAGLRCKVRLNNSTYGTDNIHTCVIKNAPRAA